MRAEKCFISLVVDLRVRDQTRPGITKSRQYFFAISLIQKRRQTDNFRVSYVDLIVATQSPERKCHFLTS